ncbi:hypothetical protein STPH1_1635 [Streptomyces sp. OM5714]|nr:hypothetical protein STPH1_1635 [Streptomyces sp. OM5714]
MSKCLSSAFQGAGIDQVAGREAVDDIGALEYFTRFVRSRQDADRTAPST